jgi:hypothetical protein
MLPGLSDLLRVGRYAVGSPGGIQQHQGIIKFSGGEVWEGNERELRSQICLVFLQGHECMRIRSDRDHHKLPTVQR